MKILLTSSLISMQNIVVVSYTVRAHVRSLNLGHRPLKVGGVVDPKKHTPAVLPHTLNLVALGQTVWQYGR